MRVDALFLDAGGVLMHPSWERVAAALQDHGLAVSAAGLQRAEPHAKKELDTEARNKATNDNGRSRRYFELILEKAGVALSTATEGALARLAESHARRNLWESVPAEVIAALERLRAADVPLVVVSNANGTLHDQMERLGLLPYFDHVLDSSVEGVEKPDPRIFDVALERSGSCRDRTVHVGDLYHVDVVGARAAGLQGWLLDPQDLYAGYDCPRAASLEVFVDRLLEGR